MSDLIERVARQICSGGLGLDKCIACNGPAECGDHWRNFAAEARAAGREVLAAMREPSDAVALAYWNEPASRALTEDHRERTEERLGAMLDAFAREQGLEP